MNTLMNPITTKKALDGNKEALEENKEALEENKEALEENLRTIGGTWGIRADDEVLDRVLELMNGMIPHMRGPIAESLMRRRAEIPLPTLLLETESVQISVYTGLLEEIVEMGVAQSLKGSRMCDKEGNEHPLYDGDLVPNPMFQIFRRLALSLRGKPAHDALQALLPPDSDLVLFAPTGAMPVLDKPVEDRTAADVMAVGEDKHGLLSHHVLVCPHPEADFGGMRHDNMGFEIARALELEPSERLAALLTIRAFLDHLERVVQHMAAARGAPRENFLACFHMLGDHSVNVTHMHVVNLASANVVSLALNHGKNCSLATVAAIVDGFVEKTNLVLDAFLPN